MATGAGNLPYTPTYVSPFDVITSQAENETQDNITALANGTGIGDGALDTAAYKNGSVTADKVNFATFAKTWTDVKASRASNTNYTNTKNYPIEVQVTFDFSADTNSSRWRQGSLIVDGVQVNSEYTEATSRTINSVSATVPPGSTYSATAISSNPGKTLIYLWTELL